MMKTTLSGTPPPTRGCETSCAEMLDISQSVKNTVASCHFDDCGKTAADENRDSASGTWGKSAPDLKSGCSSRSRVVSLLNIDKFINGECGGNFCGSQRGSKSRANVDESPNSGLAIWQLGITSANQHRAFRVVCDFDCFRQIIVGKNATAAIMNHSGMESINEKVQNMELDS